MDSPQQIEKKITKTIKHGTTSHYKDQYCAYCTLKKEQDKKNKKIKVVLWELLNQMYTYGHFMSKNACDEIVSLIKSL